MVKVELLSQKVWNTHLPSNTFQVIFQDMLEGFRLVLSNHTRAMTEIWENWLAFCITMMTKNPTPFSPQSLPSSYCNHRLQGSRRFKVNAPSNNEDLRSNETTQALHWFQATSLSSWCRPKKSRSLAGGCGSYSISCTNVSSNIGPRCN